MLVEMDSARGFRMVVTDDRSFEQLTVRIWSPLFSERVGIERKTQKPMTEIRITSGEELKKRKGLTGLQRRGIAPT